MIPIEDVRGSGRLKENREVRGVAKADLTE
jgi:hypothetical protein